MGNAETLDEHVPDFPPLSGLKGDNFPQGAEGRRQIRIGTMGHIHGNGHFSGQHANALYMVSVFMGHDNGTQRLQGNAHRLRPERQLLKTKPVVN